MDTRREYKKGVAKEEEFITLAKTYGYGCKKSTKREDIEDHWDVELSKLNEILKVDVKSLKKIDRYDSAPNEDYIWLEIKNVHGKFGWCYAEKINGFFFERFNSWFYVEKEDAQKLIKEKVKKEYVANPNNALYKLYRRSGRQDAITLVKANDLLPYAKKTFIKT